jgi:SAM-dependent methyltransferase
MSASDPIAPWNDPERVRCFASRDPDHRLVELVEALPYPQGVTVLDLGCAGGRNAEYLARHDLDLWALDAAEAMVAETRTRVAAVLGAQEAERRVVQGTMDDLSRWADGTFHLVVALGVYHQAQSEAEWFAALGETERVLVPGGRCLVSNFAPGTGRLHEPLDLIEGTRFLYEGMHDDHLCLRDADGLDQDLATLGLVPETPTRIVERATEESRRVTVNALYKKL